MAAGWGGGADSGWLALRTLRLSQREISLLPPTITIIIIINHHLYSTSNTSLSHPHPPRSVGAEVLVDDNPRYALECAEAGIHVLLYDWRGGYPWAKTEGGGPVHDLITR